MPCAAYDDFGKLVTVIAGPGEKPEEARADPAGKHSHLGPAVRRGGPRLVDPGAGVPADRCGRG